jgi:hypothetical protein
VSDLDELFDCDRIADAGAAWGQVATRPPWGGLVVAGCRFVEHGVRAPSLLVPDLFRVDVIPSADTLGLEIRDLSPHPAKWSSAPEAWDAARRAGEHEPLDLQAQFELPDLTLAARVRLVTLADLEAGGVYVNARAAVGIDRGGDG